LQLHIEELRYTRSDQWITLLLDKLLIYWTHSHSSEYND